jgi:hypothetical protein
MDRCGFGGWKRESSVCIAAASSSVAVESLTMSRIGSVIYHTIVNLHLGQPNGTKDVFRLPFSRSQVVFGCLRERTFSMANSAGSDVAVSEDGQCVSELNCSFCELEGL